MLNIYILHHLRKFLQVKNLKIRGILLLETNIPQKQKHSGGWETDYLDLDLDLDLVLAIFRLDTHWLASSLAVRAMTATLPR